MMFSAGGGGSRVNFHLPKRGLAGWAARIGETTLACGGVGARCAVRMGVRIQSSAMRKTAILLVAALALPSSAFATWSVIAVDRSTGRVVIASATCVNGDDDFLK